MPLLSLVRSGYRPFQVVALGAPESDDVQLAQARRLSSNAPTGSATLSLSHSFWIAAWSTGVLRLIYAAIFDQATTANESPDLS